MRPCRRTVANEVAFDFGDWGVVTESKQNHEDEVDDSEPSVEYAYEDAVASYEAKYVRLDYVTYPGPSTRRKVYYHYTDSTVANAANWTAQEKIGQKLSRLRTIAAVDIDSSAIAGSDANATYTYLGASTVVKVEYPAVTNTLALTYGTSGNSYPGFDRFGRVVDHKWQMQTGGAVKDQFEYAYDYTSNRVSRDVMPDRDPVLTGHDDYYEYDALDRLMKRNRGSLDVNGAITDGSATFNQAWAENDGGWETRLDPVGNWTEYRWDDDGEADDWTTQTRTHDTANKITDISGSWVDPAYDDAGNMRAGPQPGYETVDANTQLYVYDAWNRLAKVYRDDNENDEIDDPSELVATYRYDGQNRRIRKVLAVPDPDITYDYYYNERWQVLEVRIDERTNKTYEQHVWGIQYVDAPVVRFRAPTDSATLGETLYYTYDAQFNVTALVTTAGAVAERYAYDPYGQVTVLNGEDDNDGDEWTTDTNGASDYENEILYCGYRHDPETGLYQVRHRYYHPTLGRWTTRDQRRPRTTTLRATTRGRRGVIRPSSRHPRGVYADGMNLYGCVRGNPLRYLDPFGLEALTLRQDAYLMDKEWWPFDDEVMVHFTFSEKFDCDATGQVRNLTVGKPKVLVDKGDTSHSPDPTLTPIACPGLSGNKGFQLIWSGEAGEDDAPGWTAGLAVFGVGTVFTEAVGAPAAAVLGLATTATTEGFEDEWAWTFHYTIRACCCNKGGGMKLSATVVATQDSYTDNDWFDLYTKYVP